LPEPNPPPQASLPPPSRRADAVPRKKRNWTLRLLILFVPVLALAVVSTYTVMVLNWSYSSGERAGYVQKFSKKGWICKTWEGELAMVALPGTLAEIFHFTVRSDAVAEKINRSIGKRVALAYEEHRGIPSTCFGETGYFVVDVKVVE
jgi:hypothetical protein